jgi:hypothetical protein
VVAFLGASPHKVLVVFGYAASYMWGRVVPKIGRAGCMVIATCVHLAYYIMMFFVTSPRIMHEIKYQSGGA